MSFARTVAPAIAYVDAYATAIADANATAIAYATVLLVSSPSPPPTPSFTPPPTPSFNQEEPTVMETYALTTYFPRGYIADPYWPARAHLIDIQKNSGVNRARSSANRRKALEEYLTGVGMTLAEYERLESRASEPFYRDDGGLIILPENQVLSFLVATCDEARAATRPCAPEQVRSRFVVSSWHTGKQAADGVWERFATVSTGTGAKLSNQRGLRRSEYIADFEASGTISFDAEFVDPKTLRKALEFGGNFVGIGASRKMGWGRFELRKFERVAS